MKESGVIYILTNPAFPEYVKIGYADDMESRLAQLNRSECTPFAFRVYATYEVDSRLTDMKIHDIIDKLNPNLRAIDNAEGKKRIREFYAMSASSCDIEVGETVEFYNCNNPYNGTSAIVVDDKRVEYNGETWTLTSLAKELLGSTASTPGPDYFEYKGKEFLKNLSTMILGGLRLMKFLNMSFVRQIKKY